VFRGFAVVVMLLAGCAAGSAASPTTTSTTAGPRLSAANRDALDALVASTPAVLDPDHLNHDTAGHDVWGPVPEPTLDPATAAELDAQWAAATAAARQLATPEQAIAAGYQKAAAELPGIGAHYVRWDLVDQPFDPARPSMLLYDESAVRPDRLAGFSYWLRSEGGPPEGFAGDGDHWHMHHGLCFVDGLLSGEDITDPADCRGDWLAGTDLWMGHAWVNPEVANPWGRFAPRNPAVCPAASEPVADFNRCPDPLPVAATTSTQLDGNALWCVLPGAADPA
jgi:hypothetical protein